MCAPLFHVAALNMVSLPVLMKGGTVVLTGGFDPEAALELIVRHGVTVMFGVPAMFNAMAQVSAFAPPTCPACGGCCAAGRRCRCPRSGPTSIEAFPFSRGTG